MESANLIRGAKQRHWPARGWSSCWVQSEPAGVRGTLPRATDVANASARRPRLDPGRGSQLGPLPGRVAAGLAADPCRAGLPELSDASSMSTEADYAVVPALHDGMLVIGNVGRMARERSDCGARTSRL